MRQLIWLIPLVPLAGFLINGLVYLLSHRTKNAPGHGHGHDPEEDGHNAAGQPHPAAQPRQLRAEGLAPVGRRLRELRASFSYVRRVVHRRKATSVGRAVLGE